MGAWFGAGGARGPAAVSLRPPRPSPAPMAAPVSHGHAVLAPGSPSTPWAEPGRLTGAEATLASPPTFLYPCTCTFLEVHLSLVLLFEAISNFNQ